MPTPLKGSRYLFFPSSAGNTPAAGANVRAVALQVVLRAVKRLLEVLPSTGDLNEVGTDVQRLRWWCTWAGTEYL